MITAFIKKYKSVFVVILPLVAIIALEVLLSAANLYKYKSDIKPYHVTSFLRPIVRNFVKDDFIPRTHKMEGVPWDYTTDRLRPGTYQQEAGKPEYTVNSYGIRGPEFSIPKPEGIYRIVIFGGSAVFSATSADDKMLSAALQRVLNEEIKNKKIEVLNYGIGSKSLYYNARKYFLEVETLQPDMVIIHNIRNTWFYDQNQEIFNYNDINLPERGLQTGLNHFLTDNFLIYRLFYKNYQKKATLSYMRGADDHHRDYNPVFFDVLYANVIHSIYADAERRGIKAIFSIEPVNIDAKKQLYFMAKNKTELYAALDALGTQSEADNDTADIISNTLLYNNLYTLQQDNPEVMIIDPVEYFLTMEERQVDGSLFEDRFHMSEKGNDVLAHFIAEKISGVIKHENK